MPIYAYRCTNCGHALDALRKISDPALTVCPACGAPTLVKQVTAAGFQLKGSGWYVTDFRDGKKAGGKPADGDSADKGEKADAKAGDANGDAAKADAGAKSGDAAKGSEGAKAGEGAKVESAKKAEAAPGAASPAAAPAAAAAPPPATPGKSGA
jgi:putative FmdB family regulatory protein